MATPHEHDVHVWDLLMIQTPPALIYLIIVLLASAIGLVIYIWKIHRAKVDRAISEHKLFALDSHVTAHHNYMNKKIDDVRTEFRNDFKELKANVKNLLDLFINHIEGDKGDK